MAEARDGPVAADPDSARRRVHGRPPEVRASHQDPRRGGGRRPRCLPGLPGPRASRGRPSSPPGEFTVVGSSTCRRPDGSPDARLDHCPRCGAPARGRSRPGACEARRGRPPRRPQAARRPPRAREDDRDRLRVTANTTSTIRPNAIPAAPTSTPRRVITPDGCLLACCMTVPRMTRTMPSMTVTAPATDRIMTSRILLVVAVSERTAQRSHRGYRPASHMASCNHYDRHYRRVTARSSSIGPVPPLTSLTWYFTSLRTRKSAAAVLRRYVMYMVTQADKAREFLALHRPGEPLLLPNPWDLGSARLLASLGFKALATTSSGFAATLGRNDGSVSREEALIHAAVIVAATDLPVSADLENAFADDRTASPRPSGWRSRSAWRAPR